jgi:hypothetical protein
MNATTEAVDGTTTTGSATNTTDRSLGDATDSTEATADNATDGL